MKVKKTWKEIIDNNLNVSRNKLIKQLNFRLNQIIFDLFIQFEW